MQFFRAVQAENEINFIISKELSISLVTKVAFVVRAKNSFLSNILRIE